MYYFGGLLCLMKERKNEEMDKVDIFVVGLATQPNERLVELQGYIDSLEVHK